MSIRQEVTTHVGIISFNRPDVHNAMDDETGAELVDALKSMGENAAVRAIVLRGEGRSFCSGRDLRVLGQRREGDSDYAVVKRLQAGVYALLDCPKPIVAAVKGAAVGAGFEYALAADLRVVGRGAKLSLPEVVYGIVPDLGGTQNLTSLVGRARAKRLIMTGERLGGEQAFDWGIADWLVEDEEVDGFALEIAARIASHSPQAVMMSKHLVDHAEYGAIRTGMRQELTSMATLFKSDDFREAIQALREKRAPQYTGK